jgi:hypoxanthine phosphoribosyltransferase
VVEGARLEIAYPVLSRIVGSNPTHSARLFGIFPTPCPLPTSREGVLSSREHPMTLETLICESDLHAGIKKLGDQIRADYGDEPILLVGVLKGSLYFLADLSRQLGENVEIDFVQVSSYGKERSSSGVVKIVKDIDINIEGRNVLIVEDIVDTGITLAHLREMLGTRKPRSLKVAALLDKTDAHQVETPVEYVGFPIPNRFVVGYGLDDAEKYRNLPYVAILLTGQSE